MRPRENEVVFVIDEDAGPSVAQGIVEAGGRVHMVPRATPDVEWLPQARLWGHAILSKNIEMRRVREERDALEHCGCHVFILRCHGLTFDALRAFTADNYHAMLRYVLKVSPPFIAHVTNKGIDVKLDGGRRGDKKKGV